MTIEQLIQKLSECNPKDEIYIWVDGERLPIWELDDMDGYVDINAKID
jgi:hypothetical protein